MKIIVLAAGEGKRMWPIQTDKCLIPFLGQPLLYHNLKKLRQHLEGESVLRNKAPGSHLDSRSSGTLPGEPSSPAEFVIVATPQSKDQVSRIAQALSLESQVVVQQQPKGMADAILSAKDLIDGEVLVVNAEDILDPGVFKEVLKVKGEVVVTGLKVDKYFPGGYLKVTGDRLQGIVEKPGEGSEPSDLVKLVVDYFKDGKKLIEYLEKAATEKDDQYEVALDRMIKDGMDVRFTKYSEIWIPLKYPWHVLDVTAHFLSRIEQKISPAANVSEKAVVEGQVVIEEGVRVFEGAMIKGPCYIGKNCIVGNNSMVRQSNLEEGCVTGFNSDITRSYIGANSWFHTNYIGDSVIEGDFGMGSGAVLANLRLDDHTIRVGDPSASSGQVDSGRHKLGLMAGKGSRVGVNTSTMPGARIGSNSLVGPGVVLYGDVKENKKVLVKQEFEVTEHTPALTSYDQFRDKLK